MFDFDLIFILCVRYESKFIFFIWMSKHSDIFVEKTIFSLLNSLYSFGKNQLAIYECIYVWTFYYLPLTETNILLLILAFHSPNKSHMGMMLYYVKLVNRPFFLSLWFGFDSFIMKLCAYTFRTVISSGWIDLCIIKWCPSLALIDFLVLKLTLK